MNIEKIKVRKLLLVLASILLLSFIGGLIFISILDDENKKIVISSINNYFNGINKGKIDYFKSFFSEFSGNLFLNLFIWIIGISIVGVVIVVFIMAIKSFLVGFSFCSVLYTYGIKGVFVGLVYIVPEIISLFILFVVSYYSIDFSMLLFKSLFRKKEYNKRVVMTRYLRLLLFSCFGFLLNALISTFLIPNILLLF